MVLAGIRAPELNASPASFSRRIGNLGQELAQMGVYTHIATNSKLVPKASVIEAPKQQLVVTPREPSAAYTEMAEFIQLRKAALDQVVAPEEKQKPVPSNESADYWQQVQADAHVSFFLGRNQSRLMQHTF